MRSRAALPQRSAPNFGFWVGGLGVRVQEFRDEGRGFGGEGARGEVWGSGFGVSS